MSDAVDPRPGSGRVGGWVSRGKNPPRFVRDYRLGPVFAMLIPDGIATDMILIVYVFLSHTRPGVTCLIAFDVMIFLYKFHYEPATSNRTKDMMGY